MGTSRLRYSILLSAGIQLALGAFTAHPYDGRVFFTVGYSVAHGNSPYVPVDVSGVFGRTLFSEAYPGIGYPPPWSLVLALAYLLSYNLLPNMILYNIAIKAPIVAGNLLLALLVGRIVLSDTSNADLSDNATRFMLFNPYVIYTTAIWGQFDTLSMLLMLYAVFELTRRKWRLSAVALGGAISLKLIPVVLLPLLILNEAKRGSWFSGIKYFVCVAAVVGFSFAPFLLGWTINPIVENWNVHFVRIGAFSPLNLLIPFGIVSATNELTLLGYLWIASLVLTYYLLLRRPIIKSSGLLLSALVVMLALSLSRSWVSEQNQNFVLPLVLLASISRGWSKKWVAATWLLPLIFTIFHSSPLGMLFLVVPQQLIDHVHVQLQLLSRAFSPYTLQLDIGTVARTLITLAWLIVGLMLLRKSFRDLRSFTSAGTSDAALRTAPNESDNSLTNLRMEASRGLDFSLERVPSLSWHTSRVEAIFYGGKKNEKQIYPGSSGTFRHDCIDLLSKRLRMEFISSDHEFSRWFWRDDSHDPIRLLSNVGSPNGKSLPNRLPGSHIDGWVLMD